MSKSFFFKEQETEEQKEQRKIILSEQKKIQQERLEENAKELVASLSKKPKDSITSVFGVKILVENIELETVKNHGTILLIEDKANRPLKGKVFMVGGQVHKELENRKDEDINEGDVILFDRTDYPTLSSEGKEYLKIFLDNVICKLSANS